MTKRIMSGMRPTGKLHLGHYLGVIKNWVELQNQYECFYQVADWHALTTKYDKTENLSQDVFEVVADWLACGIDPEKSTIYVQSLVPETAELHIYLSMITPQNWVERDPTLKDMAKILNSKYQVTGQPPCQSQWSKANWRARISPRSTSLKFPTAFHLWTPKAWICSRTSCS